MTTDCLVGSSDHKKVFIKNLGFDNNLKPRMAMPVCKIGIFGNCRAGTSSIVRSFSREDEMQCQQYTCVTIEDSSRILVNYKNEQMVLEIFDIPFINEFHAIRDAYILDVRGIILVYDISNKQSFSSLKDLMELVTTVRMAKKNDQRLDNFRLAIVGNKCDLEAERAVTPQEGKQFAATRNALFFETSARMRINIDELFHELGFEVFLLLQEMATYNNTEKKKKNCILS